MRTFLLLACAVMASGQAAFEVASIKPGGDEASISPRISAGRLQWTTDLTSLVAYAHDLDISQVSGIKYFPDSRYGVYDIEAVFDPAVNNAQVREMLRSLLAERFRMQARMTTEEADGYALTVGPRGFKGTAAHPDSGSSLGATNPRAGVTRITGVGGSMPYLARTLQRLLREPVWDRTGLRGGFNFEFEYAREESVDTGAPWLGTALEESLGLRLEKGKGPKQVLIVDRLEAPSEN